MRARTTLSRCLAVAGLSAVVAGVATTGSAGTVATPAAEKSVRELLAGTDGSVVPRIEDGRDKLLQTAAVGAAHAASPGLGSSARLAAAQQAASLPVAGNDSWRAAHDVFRADDPRFAPSALGWKELGGRTITLAVDPRDSTGDTVWAGSAGGGVWRSTDGGTSWTPTFDDQPSTAIGAIALSPRTGWVYAGTGEANTNGDGLYGTGIYRTKDDGETWERVPANLGEASTVSHVALSRPEGSSVDWVFVATNQGLYVSTDGGDSYTDAALPTNEAGTAPYTETRFGSVVTDVRVKPDDPSIVTAAVGWRRGKQLDYNGKPDAVGNGLYRSTEGGRPGTWQRMETNLGAVTAPGASDDPLGRISLAYAEGEGQDHDIMWAVVQDAGLFTQDPYLGLSTTTLPAGQRPTTLAGVYSSFDNGTTWTLKLTSPSFYSSQGTAMATLLASQSAPGVQAWYDQYVEVDPVDANRVIIGLEEVYTTIGNPNIPGEPAQVKTISRYWNQCAVVLNCNSVPTYTGTTAHPDQHAAAFAKVGDAGVRLYIGNDGGVFSQEADALGDSVNPLGGYDNMSWKFANVGLTTTQPNYAVIGGDGTIYAGQQDNGTLKVEPGSRTAHMVHGGDGVDVAVDPTDSDIVHAETQNGAFVTSSDGGQSFSSRTTSITNPLFYTPFEMDPKDPEHLVIGGRQVAEKTDGAGGAAFAVSFDLGINEDNDIVNQVSAIDVVGSAVYAGYCGACDPLNQGNNDPASFNNGIAANVTAGCTPEPGTDACWSKRAAKGLPNRYITDLEIDPVDPRTVYVTLGNYGRRWFKVADDAPGNADGNVWVSKDGGESFTNLTRDLPDSPATAVVVRDDQLIVGTEVGVFVAPKTGGSWSRLGSGLPNAPAFDLNLDPKGRKMVAALHGRSVWTYDFGAAALNPPVTAPPGGGSGPGSGNGGVIPVTGGVPLAALGVALLAAAVLVRRRATAAVPAGRHDVTSTANW